MILLPVLVSCTVLAAILQRITHTSKHIYVVSDRSTSYLPFTFTPSHSFLSLYEEHLLTLLWPKRFHDLGCPKWGHIWPQPIVSIQLWEQYWKLVMKVLMLIKPLFTLLRPKWGQKWPQQHKLLNNLCCWGHFWPHFGHKRVNSRTFQWLFWNNDSFSVHRIFFYIHVSKHTKSKKENCNSLLYCYPSKDNWIGGTRLKVYRKNIRQEVPEKCLNF